MSTLSQFVGGTRPPAAIVNAFSTSGFTVTSVARPDLQATNSGARSVLSGSMPTAATLYTILNIAGAGAIDFLAAWTTDATSRTVRVQLTLDGVVVFDSTSAAIAITLSGFTVLGGNANGLALLEPVNFRQSCLVRVASSLGSETDKLGIGYKYWTN